MEYVIEMIDSEPAKRWDGPNGTVYYKNVGLGGHPKPVSIGKKTPDALKVGDTVYGTIVPTDYLTDKWKGEAKPPGSSQGSSSTLDYEPSTNTRWAIALAYRAFVQVTGSVEDSGGEFPFKAVELHAIELLKMFDKLKSGSLGSLPTQEPATNEPRGVAAPSLKANWDKTTGKAVSYDDPPLEES